MSLWHKPMELVTFEDIEIFCQQGHAEGPRLDYKAEIPSKLHKLVAAFANSLGGLIVIGIEADRVTNKPAWPPKGMKKNPGIEEQITAKCRDNIYPPLRPQISPIIENPHDSGTALCVIRVDESREAPHAVDGYIYERTGSQGDGFHYAKIERIGHLLERRGRIEDQRRDLVSRDLKRAAHQLVEIRLRLGEKAGLGRSLAEEPGPRGLPLRWASVIPVYPWRDLCDPKTCYESLGLFGFELAPNSRQQVPGGAFAKKKKLAGISTESAVVGCCSLSAKGHVFAMECTTETLGYADRGRKTCGSPPAHPSICLDLTARFAREVFEVAAKFYKHPGVELPGSILLSIGLYDVLDAQMVQHLSDATTLTGERFLDEEFGADVTVTSQEFLLDPAKAAETLLQDLKFGFDL
ncbi:MAG: helix-turn-helix domain-containing protein [Isosphaeraceae bacterium]